MKDHRRRSVLLFFACCSMTSLLASGGCYYTNMGYPSAWPRIALDTDDSEMGRRHQCEDTAGLYRNEGSTPEGSKFLLESALFRELLCPSVADNIEIRNNHDSTILVRAVKDGVTCKEKVLVRGRDYSCSDDGLEMMMTGYFKGVRDSVGTLADSETRTFMKARDNSLVLRIVYSKIDVLLAESLAIPVGHGKAVWYRYEATEGGTEMPK